MQQLMPSSSHNPNPSRRRFLQTTLLAAAAPAIHPTGAHAQSSTDPVIEVAVMGLKSRGTDLLKEFLATRRVHVSWLCDVDQRVLENSARFLRQQQTREFRTTADIRQALEDPRLGAVVIAAPDHWHAPAAILATQANKHVYVEKPLTHNPREGEWLVSAVQRAGTVLQVGLQRRSSPWVMDAIRRVQDGAIGKVHLARAWYGANRGTIGQGQQTPPPAWLDFELWQGPAPDRPFRDNLVHYQWHWFWHWGTGELGNNGVHFLDLARWGLNVDCPRRVTSVGGRYAFQDDQETPDTQLVTYDFGDCTILWEHRSCLPQPLDGEDAGVMFYGDKGGVVIGGSGFRILDPRGKELERVQGGVPTAPHVDNFLDAIRNRELATNASVVEGNRSTLLCHLGNIAQRMEGDLHMNPKSSQPRDPANCSKLWAREYRPGWEPRVQS